jgi:hypothetical protein
MYGLWRTQAHKAMLEVIAEMAGWMVYWTAICR